MVHSAKFQMWNKEDPNKTHQSKRPIMSPMLETYGLSNKTSNSVIYYATNFESKYKSGNGRLLISI